MGPPKRDVKLLLLGTGESGKSTILKQMRLHHVGGYTDEERDGYREIVYANLIQSMQVVIEALHDLNMPLAPHLRDKAAYVMSIRVSAHDPCPPMLDRLVTQALIALWAEPTTKACVAKSREFQLNDSASYYFDSAARIGAADYVPTDQDILRSRVKTTGLTEERFQVGMLQYVVFDVGGQRSERKKWIHCFENVNVLIFLVAISEYDQTLYEDSDINRMNEAAGLFESISNSRWFAQSSVILFMNKTDLFKAKLITSPIYEYYSDYEGPSDYPTGCAYMESKFRPLYRNGHNRPLHVHFTCATDTEQLRVVFNAVEESIMAASIAELGLL
ncbi:BZ3500_MvSof-1268-A1-R1_Chr11-2g03331 [Microbotryum saponariae]|uniref:BZ3500_MvSof-1268-A1-R1_Chr11-2g03331 protein n=1 Tax=Microbotryum saponariae TaxID=289078 RepID=A0A2X0MRT5_9BASI|nr:BZ3500_MvSof-1268-A1-R1_Chr11-2g03331 [Microbotryum saponariae]SDA03141.1 BZ3501_MvSof-1269-A2-R1_Chr11g02902 [Microbotryum saponariae]